MNRHFVNIISWIFILMAGAGIFYYSTQYSGDETEIRVASAKKGGYYNTFGGIITEQFNVIKNYKAELLESKGSVHNSQLLLTGKADMAIVQTSAIISSLKKLEVIAPLWHDYVHVIVRKDSKIKDIKGLIGKKVALGGSGSGHRASAARILPYYGINLAQLEDNTASYRNLLKDKSIIAAIVTTTLANPVIKKAMASGQFKLLPLPTVEGFGVHNSDYEATAIPPGVYPAGTSPLPLEAVPSLRSLAVLAGRKGLSDNSVKTMLNVLNSINTRTQAPILLSESAGTEGLWLKLPIHIASKRYYDPLKTVTTLADNVEGIFSHAQLGLFILFTIAALLFKIKVQQKNNESREEEKYDREFSKIFQSLLDIESKTKRARSVRLLREYQNDLEDIKQKGIKLIFGTPLKNSPLFSSFMLLANQVGSRLDYLIANGTEIYKESLTSKNTTEMEEQENEEVVDTVEVKEV